MKTLFICTGNMCRSPAAEKLLLAKGAAGIEARSRGTAAQPYRAMPGQVKDFLEKNGITDLEHRPALVSELDVDWADIILVMENHHYEVLAERFPQSARKMHLFLEYCEGGEGAQLKDPMGKGDEEFERVLGVISGTVDVLVKRITACR